MNIVIIGGGYLGQLLHSLIPSARVLDWRPVSEKGYPLPRNFGPQYLWRPIPGLYNDSFTVVTTVDGMPATQESILAYKRKVGKQQDQSDWRTQFQQTMNGFEVHLPPDRVEYGMRVVRVNCLDKYLICANGHRVDYNWLISTIPLPELLKLCAIGISETFESRPIYVTSEPVEPLSYLSVNYLSDPFNIAYRETIRNGQLHRESLDALPNSRVLRPGKIYRNGQAAHHLAELLMYKIKSVGRYGSWNPEELAHETYSELRTWKEIINL